MNDTVKEVIDHLQKYYAKKLNETALANYGAKLDRLDPDVLCACVHNVTDKEVIFPTPFIIGRYYNEAREAAHENQKHQAPIFADLERNANRTTHGRESMRLMIQFQDGKLNREQYLAGTFAMEEKYPGVGWKQNAEELKAFWDAEPQRHVIGRDYLQRTGKVATERDLELKDIAKRPHRRFL